METINAQKFKVKDTKSRIKKKVRIINAKFKKLNLKKSQRDRLLTH